jgi:Ca2+-binding EF-hand superfamily protein
MNLFKAGKNLMGGGDGMNPMAMFKQLDRNGDGQITEEDFVDVVKKAGLGEVGEQAIKQVFRQIDKNHNGKLEMSEALAAYEQVTKLFNMAKGQK